MPTLPIRPVTRPRLLDGHQNGRLPDSILVDTPGQAGGYTVRLVEPAARAWRAMCAAAAADGHILKASGPLDSYRPYWAQEQEFLSRYQTQPIVGASTRVWKGQTWYQKPGTAAAAPPGSSNHGWGLAVDCGEERDGDPGPESLDAGTLQWLVDNEHRFGFSHELQSEPWHIRYTTGDAIPKAVLDYEAAHPFTPGGVMLARCKFGDRGQAVVELMEALHAKGYELTHSRKADGSWDGIYGPGLAADVAHLAGETGDHAGREFGPRQLLALFRGEPGPAGPPGRDGELQVGSEVVLLVSRRS